MMSKRWSTSTHGQVFSELVTMILKECVVEGCCGDPAFVNRQDR
jgi:hypothetical protein